MTPLVSIGLPTVGRAEMISVALDSLLAQTHPNLEIVVSDNCSEDETSAVCRAYASRYPLVHYFRQSERVPVMVNFRSALAHSTGKYFMWASDDDRWEPGFVAMLVAELEADRSLALVAAEARYCLADGTLLDFFPEGTFWYAPPARSAFGRVRAVLSHNYGNLIYGLYRRDVLIDGDQTVLDSVRFINEIPIFLRVAAAGEVRVRPEVMFYKTTNRDTYGTARREYGLTSDQVAATRPRAAIARVRRRLRSVKGLADYHLATLLDISRALRLTNLSTGQKVWLTVVTAASLGGHFLKLSLVWPTQDATDSRSDQ